MFSSNALDSVYCLSGGHLDNYQESTSSVTPIFRMFQVSSILVIVLDTRDTRRSISECNHYELGLQKSMETHMVGLWYLYILLK